jgi:hypothetical protein
MISAIDISSSVCGPTAARRPIKNKEAAGMRRLRLVMTLRAAYVSDVKYQPFWIRFAVMGA